METKAGKGDGMEPPDCVTSNARQCYYAICRIGNFLATAAQTVAVDANNDMVKQISDVEDMLSQSIGVLVMDPRDAKGLVGVTKEAAAAKIPVIIDSSIDDSAPALATIQSNNAENGRLVGDWVVSQVKEPLKIALLSGDPGNLVGEARRDGVMGGILEAQLRQNGRAGFTVGCRPSW